MTAGNTLREKGKKMGSKMKDTTIQSVQKVKDIQIGKKQVAPPLEKKDRVKAAHHDTDDEEDSGHNRFEEEHSFHELSEHDEPLDDHNIDLEPNGADLGLPAGATSPISVQSASSMNQDVDGLEGPFPVGPTESFGSGTESDNPTNGVNGQNVQNGQNGGNMKVQNDQNGQNGQNGVKSGNTKDFVVELASTTPTSSEGKAKNKQKFKKRVTVTSLNVRTELVELPDDLPFSHIVYGENYVPTNTEKNMEEMKDIDLRDEAIRIIRALYAKYIEVGSEMELNLSHKLRKKSLAKLAVLDELDVHQMEQYVVIPFVVCRCILIENAMICQLKEL